MKTHSVVGVVAVVAAVVDAVVSGTSVKFKDGKSGFSHTRETILMLLKVEVHRHVIHELEWGMRWYTHAYKLVW